MPNAKSSSSKASPKKSTPNDSKSVAHNAQSPKKSSSKSVIDKKVNRKPVKVTPQLTTEARRKLLKPRDGYDELVERVARTWEVAKELRVPGLSVAKLRKLLKDADRAKTKENKTREKLERTLRTLYDSRLLAEDKTWRAVLDVNAAVKLYARNSPALAETFAFLTDALTSNPGKSEQRTADEE